jgi:hypothetical protein
MILSIIGIVNFAIKVGIYGTFLVGLGSLALWVNEGVGAYKKATPDQQKNNDANKKGNRKK